MNARLDHARLEGLLDELRATDSKAARTQACDAIQMLTRPYMRTEPEIDWHAYHLTGQEIRVADFLHTKRGKLVKHEQIMDVLYYDRIDEFPHRNIVAVLICRIRKKLDGSPWQIKTVWGVGFRMQPNGCQLDTAA
jgi:DNA-binding response OmpR family regulator